MNILDAPMEIEYFDKAVILSLREYLALLLTDLWEYRSQFEGKRPYGSSGWYFDVYRTLIMHGYIQGTLDEDNNVEELSEEERQKADEMIRDLIRSTFRNA